MEWLLTHADGIINLVGALAVLIVSIFGVLAALGVQRKTWQERLEKIAEQAMLATEQWKKIYTEENGVPPTGEQLKHYALNVAAQLGANADWAIEQVDTLIEAQIARVKHPILRNTLQMVEDLVEAKVKAALGCKDGADPLALPSPSPR
jgi:hypothetical protein